MRIREWCMRTRGSLNVINYLFVLYVSIISETKITKKNNPFRRIFTTVYRTFFVVNILRCTKEFMLNQKTTKKTHRCDQRLRRRGELYSFRYENFPTNSILYAHAVPIPSKFT